mgnify:CR=1 FL=1
MVSTGPEVGRLSRLVRSFRGVFPAFWSLSCFALVVVLANMALFRVLRAFLARFMGFVWVCVAWALCVACVAFVRVWS